MNTSMQAELLKLRKRPASWILGTLLCVVVLCFGYVLTYVLTLLPNPNNDPAITTLIEEQRQALLPVRTLSVVLPQIAGLGGPIALILGALVMGSEYSWFTIKTILTQRSTRRSIFIGKLLATAIVLLVFVLLAFAIGGASSVLLAGAQGAPIQSPSLQDIVRAVGSAWIITGAWAMLGVCFATLFRSTALAIGLGLVYAFVIENMISFIAAQRAALEGVRDVLLGVNADALSQTFRNPSSINAPAAVPIIAPMHATLMLAAYVLVFGILALLVFVRRDVAQ